MDYKGKKDSNDVLILDGAETLRTMVLEAKPIPLHGLNSMDFYADEFQNLYERENLQVQALDTQALTSYSLLALAI